MLKSYKKVADISKIQQVLAMQSLFSEAILWPLFMDGVQLAQGYSHVEEAVYFLPLSSQKFLVPILSTSKGWKAELSLEPPSGFEKTFRQ